MVMIIAVIMVVIMVMIMAVIMVMIMAVIMVAIVSANMIGGTGEKSGVTGACERRGRHRRIFARAARENGLAIDATSAARLPVERV
jgi:hypothetical protein